MDAPKQSDLKRLVGAIQKSGLAMVEANLKASQLADDEKNYLAALMNSLASGEKRSEAQLEREARGSKEFREYVRGRCIAQAEAGRLKVRYQALQSLFEAKRSELALEREKISKGIFHSGG